jgi:hypothetical protein
MSILLVGTFLPGFDEAKGSQPGGNFVRLEDWDIAHD